MENDEKVPGYLVLFHKMQKFLKYGGGHIKFKDMDLCCKEKKRLQCLRRGIAKTCPCVGIHEKARIQNDPVRRRMEHHGQGIT